LFRKVIKDARHAAAAYSLLARAVGDGDDELKTVSELAMPVSRCGVGVAEPDVGTPDCKTELVPVTAGRTAIDAISMKAAAAPIVIFASNVCVPRGPKAVLETELVNRAPASAFPGCNNTTRIRITQARMNNPYKT
jgi:hypothetical protein